MTITKEEMEIRRNTKLPPEYDVGYAQPPTASRFPPGVSGNPSGRPPGSKNKPHILGDKYFYGIMRDEIYRQVPIENEHDEDNATASAVRAVTRNLVKSAIGGDFKAAQWVLERARIIERAAAAEIEEEFEYASAYKERWARRIKDAKEFGWEIPQPVPHPDHINLDHRRRTVTYTGPRNAEEKAEDDARLAANVKASGEEATAPEQAVELGEVADQDNMVELPEQKTAGEVIASTENTPNTIQVPRAGTPCAVDTEVSRPAPPLCSNVYEEPRLRTPTP